jgi:hypothetical protein
MVSETPRTERALGRGRDDSEISGPLVSGPDGERDQACGPRARYVIYV